MLITVKTELSFSDLQNQCWSGAVDTLNTIYENDKEDEFMSLLEEVFFTEMPTLTAINDLCWFESDWIFEQLGISDDDDDYDDEEDNDDYDDDFDEEENAMLLRGDDEYVDRVAEEIMNR